MDYLLTWIAYGVAALVFAACVVAWYEHLGRSQRREEARDWESPRPKLMHVDVELDALAAEAQGGSGGDVSQRREALGGAMNRMTSARPGGFGDTAPMVLPSGPAASPGERRQRDAAPAP